MMFFERFPCVNFVLIIFFLALVGMGCGPSVSELNQLAIECIERGDFTQAESLLQSALRLSPREKILILNLTRVYGHTGKHSESVRVLQTALSQAELKNDQDLKTALAEALYQSGRPGEVVDLVNSLLETATTQTQEYLYLLKGVAVEDPRQAIESLGKAWDLNPDRLITYLAEARAHIWNGDLEAAGQVLKDTRNKFGDSLELDLFQISLLMVQNEYEKARVLLEKLKTTYPDELRLQLYDAYLALAEKQFDVAQALFEDLSTKPELKTRAGIGQAICLLALGDTALAIETSEKLLKENKDQPLALNILGLGQLKRMQRFLAKKTFEQSLSLNPGQPSIRALVDRIGAR